MNTHTLTRNLYTVTDRNKYKAPTVTEERGGRQETVKTSITTILRFEASPLDTHATLTQGEFPHCGEKGRGDYSVKKKKKVTPNSDVYGPSILMTWIIYAAVTSINIKSNH
ncbi:unnamed protein product [Rangifer tarandus platyrhynchus]|uniref:Uncharacterized protein n=2 Tax=Rangifer tarandus platyrhynchus TaxID=3082113 RepID=A0AC59ZF98_RANTA|nr:unnamed protein product [Rangifer tarandus platyrhynchus]